MPTARASFSKKKVDFHQEQLLLAGMIMDERFLREVRSIYNTKHLKNNHVRIVAEWCLDYYTRYETCPSSNIETFYHTAMRDGMEDADAQAIGKFIENINAKAASGHFENFNVEHALDEVEAYFKLQATIALKEDLDSYIRECDPNGAEECISNWARVERPKSTGVNPFTDENLILSAFAEAEEPLYKFPGAAGELVNEYLIRGAFVGIMGMEKSGKCLPASEKVLLEDGRTVSIAEIANMEAPRVMCWDLEKQQFTSQEVSNFFDNGKKPVFKLTTKTGRSITCTSNHPLLTPDGWVPLEKLRQKEFIAVPRVCPVFGNKPMTQDHIGLLAYFITDGCCVGKNPKFTKQDKDIQQDFEYLVESMGCSVTWYDYEAEVQNSKANYGKHKCNYVRHFLIEHGLDGKLSHEKRIPDCIYQLPKEQLSLFLNILFTCDGWAARTDCGQYGLAFSNEVLSRQVQELLTRFGIVSKLRKKKTSRRDSWEISISDYENMSLFIKEIGFSFSKQDKALDILSEKKPSLKSFLDRFPVPIGWRLLDKAASLGVSLGKGKYCKDQLKKNKPIMRQSFINLMEDDRFTTDMHSQVLWDEIVDISYVGEENTYDISVPTHHNFVANNVIVHNSWCLQEHAMRAAAARLNVAFFATGDMNEKEMALRKAIYIAQRSNTPKYCGKIHLPVLDCARNQCNSCRIPKRACRVGLLNEDGTIPQVGAVKGYVPCAKCADMPGFEGAVWYTIRDKVDPLTGQEAVKLNRWWSEVRMKNREYKMCFSPAGSINVDKINSQLSIWCYMDNWTPDVIIIDYADILEPEPGDGKNSVRDQQNGNWKALRRLSQEWHALVVTATQTDAASYDQGLLRRKNFSEDKRKYGHSTVTIGLNQTPQEQAAGLQRWNVIMARAGEYNEFKTATILRSLQIGRPFLDSFWTPQQYEESDEES